MSTPPVADVVNAGVKSIVASELNNFTKLILEKTAEQHAVSESRIMEELKLLSTQLSTFMASSAGEKRKAKKAEVKEDVAAGAAPGGSPAASATTTPAPADAAATVKVAPFRPRNLWFRDKYLDRNDTSVNGVSFRAAFTEAAKKADPTFEDVMEKDKGVSSKAEGKKDNSRADFAYKFMQDKMPDWQTKTFLPLHEAAKKAAQTNGVKIEQAKIEALTPKQ